MTASTLNSGIVTIDSSAAVRAPASPKSVVARGSPITAKLDRKMAWSTTPFWFGRLIVACTRHQPPTNATAMTPVLNNTARTSSGVIPFPP